MSEVETLVIVVTSGNHAKRWSGPVGQHWRIEGHGLAGLPFTTTARPIRDAAAALQASGYPERETFFALQTPKNDVLVCCSIAEGLRSIF